MAKSMKKHQIRAQLRSWAVIAGVLCIVAITVALILICKKDNSNYAESESFFQKAELIQTQSEQLCDGLLLQGVGRYTGLFLEDGSRDQVNDVLMIQLKNTGKRDLQLAGLSLTFEDFTAEFDITNLPAGATMIVLEKNRRPFVNQRYLNMSLRNVVYFDKNLGVDADIFEVTGKDGAISLKNVSSLPIEGDIYVTYKYISGDILYGGITFRATLPGGLKSGEIKQITARHFVPENCVVVQIGTGG